MFSSRLPPSLTPNRLARAVEQARGDGQPIIDLTESNPTRAGFEYPDDLLAPLGDARGLTYVPRPLGVEEARRAVARDYQRRGITASPDRIVLTASTSDAYALLFKVLCDPGDEVLVPRPSYPLFEHLTELDAVVAKPYDLEYHGTWSVDEASLERAWSERTRAVLLVSPNNPTGSFVTREELDRIAEICAAHQAAIVADEVFADYELVEGAAARAGQVLAGRDVLAFSLGGLSKSVGLPQVKLGWIAAAGPDAIVREALARLELVCDTYLSVSTPVQGAAGELLARGAAVREQIRARVTANDRELIARAEAAPACHVLAAEGGWYAVIQVPALTSEEDLVLDLLTKHRVLVHPGYFFDFPRESYLVVSLLAPSAVFRDGISRVFGHFDGPTRG
jgi:hypothetical protein